MPARVGRGASCTRSKPRDWRARACRTRSRSPAASRRASSITCSPPRSGCGTSCCPRARGSAPAARRPDHGPEKPRSVRAGRATMGYDRRAMRGGDQQDKTLPGVGGPAAQGEASPPQRRPNASPAAFLETAPAMPAAPNRERLATESTLHERAATESTLHERAATDPTLRSEPTLDARHGATLPGPHKVADLPSLQRIDDSAYAIGHERARGGMGKILFARDRRLRRDVVIKVARRQSGRIDPRFEREALITARLQHPSIVRVYDAGVLGDGRAFYAMEQVRGRSLEVVIAEAKTLRDRLALLPHAIAVADAIAYAHSEGVLHRDLK